MKKITTLFIALLVLGAANTYAGNAPESNKAQFQFTTLGLTQNSWDYAYLKYNVNDLATGEVLEIPSFLINYEVRDRGGKVISNGSGLYMNVMDKKLGSEEDYTVVVSTMVNGQKLTQSVCRKASPKKLAMKVNTAELETGAGSLAYTVTRPKFSRPEESETIDIEPAGISLNVALNNTAYKINVANSGVLAEQAAYQSLRKDLAVLAQEGKNAQLTVEPALIFKGEVYTDKQTYYEVTAGGFTEVISLEAVASK